MILGLNGLIGAGKNETAKRLAVLSPLPVIEVSYARKLKESVAALFGITLEQIEEWKNDPNARVITGIIYGDHCQEVYTAPGVEQTFREFLQQYGTEAHRDVFGQDFWLDAALPTRGQEPRAWYQDALYVVTDMRFPNEQQRVKELGGYTALVVGSDYNLRSSTEVMHASEQLLECDFTIFNVERDDNYESLDAECRRVLKEVGLDPVN